MQIPQKTRRRIICPLCFRTPSLLIDPGCFSRRMMRVSCSLIASFSARLLLAIIARAPGGPSLRLGARLILCFSGWPWQKELASRMSPFRLVHLLLPLPIVFRLLLLGSLGLLTLPQRLVILCRGKLSQPEWSLQAHSLFQPAHWTAVSPQLPFCCWCG